MQTALLLAALALSAQAGRYGEAAIPELPAKSPTLPAADQPAAPPASTASAVNEPTALAGQSQLTINADPTESKTGPTAAAPPAARPLQSAPPAENSLLANNGPKPSEVVRTLLTPPVDGKLVGSPVTLGEAVREARSRQDQTARAKAYWELSAAVGDYYLALLEQRQLTALRQQITAPGQAWEPKLRDSAARVELAQHTAAAAQLRLQQLIGVAANGSLPLPSDAPHCGRYNTEYEEIFAGHPNTAARQLADLMPLRFEQLRTQAKAIVEAHDWLNQVSLQRDTTTDGTGLLQAYDLLSLRRRAFLTTACDYNKEIAAYTELAAPAQVAPDRLVAMMIRASTDAATPPWQRDRIQQTAANEDITPTPELPAAQAPPASTASAADAAPPQNTTPRGNRTFRQFRPLQRLFNREKSIVVDRLIQRRHNSDDNDDQ